MASVLHLRRTMIVALLMSFLAMDGLLLPAGGLLVVQEAFADEPCPACELLFTKLEGTGRDGKLVQDIRVHERGEPKSGTGILFDWASATLLRTCHHLQGLFGKTTSSTISCFVVKSWKPGPCPTYQLRRRSISPRGDDLRHPCQQKDWFQLSARGAAAVVV